MRRGILTGHVGIALAVVGWMGIASDAHAATTQIVAPTSEANHQQVFNDMFGGTFVSDGLNFSNGEITAQRVDDNVDRIIASGQFGIQTAARFAGFDQSFGFVSGNSGGEFNELFTVNGFGFGATGDATLDIPDESFRWARRGINGTFTTSDVDNVGGRDHVATFQILGQGITSPTTVLFFEDMAGASSDLDFNDLVVQVTRLEAGTGTTPPASVPSPAAVWPGLALLFGLMGFHRRRRANGDR